MYVWGWEAQREDPGNSEFQEPKAAKYETVADEALEAGRVDFSFVKELDIYPVDQSFQKILNREIMSSLRLGLTNLTLHTSGRNSST